MNPSCVKCFLCESVVEEDDMNAMGCDSRGCDRWYHYECLESDVRAIADLSLIDHSEWMCPWCESRVERVCEVCLMKEMVIDDVAKGISTGWAKCGNGWCARWYHLECLPRDERAVLERGTIDWMCRVCFTPEM